jgi:hypothetical protein
LTCHEGRHTHATWLTEDGLAEVARRASLLALTAAERARLVEWFPHLRTVVTRLMIENRDGKNSATAISAPLDH